MNFYKDNAALSVFVQSYGYGYHHHHHSGHDDHHDHGHHKNDHGYVTPFPKPKCLYQEMVIRRALELAERLAIKGIKNLLTRKV